MPHAWVNGNPEIEPWRSIDVAEKAFAFSGVELTVFLSGSEIWSPATVNGTETRCHQREMRVLMRWGNAARIESREGSAAPRNRKTSSYLHPDPQKNEESHKAELQSFKPLDKRGVNFYFLCLSMDVTHSILRGSTARFPRKTVRERLLASFYCGSGRRGVKALTPHRGGSAGGGPDTCSNWTPPRSLLKHRSQAQMPGKQSTQRDFAHARHTLAAFSGRQQFSKSVNQRSRGGQTTGTHSCPRGPPGQGGKKLAGRRQFSPFMINIRWSLKGTPLLWPPLQIHGNTFPHTYLTLPTANEMLSQRKR